MDVLSIDTPRGPGRLLLAEAPQPRAVLLLGHGANGAVNAYDLQLLADRLPDRGISVARFEQPWKTAGGKVSTPPPTLDDPWRSAVDAVAERWPALPLIVGGRSAGARVACRTFAPPALGVICLAFPLHLPGQPEKSRIAELAGVAGPVLIFQGNADPFGTGDELGEALRLHPAAGTITVVDVVGAHSFGPRTAAARSLAPALETTIVERCDAFVSGLVDTVAP